MQPGEIWSKHFGFRSGDKGTHTSRTMMFQELETLLNAIPGAVDKSQYVAAIIEDNVFGKSTLATRKLSAQRLSELYSLDSSVPLFRVLRHLWSQETSDRPLLSFLCAYARDPLLRFSMDAVLPLVSGEELSRQKMTNSLKDGTGNRMNDATLDKVVRNVGSSWTQSGHLEGRVRKIRRKVRPTPAAVTYSLVLGYLQGLRGGRLFETPWTRLLDLSAPEVREFALEAKRMGLLDLKMAGDVVEISFNHLLTSQEIKDSSVTY